MANEIKQEDVIQEKTKQKKPVYKMWWFWLIVATLIIALFGCDREDTENTNNEIILSEPFEFEGGDFIVTVQSYSLVKGWEDETVLKIVYDFTNNGEEEAYGHDIMFTGYQNGIELYSGYSDDINYDIGEKGVKPGATIQGVEYGVSLEDNSEVEIEAECWHSFEEEVFVTTVEPSSLSAQIDTVEDEVEEPTEESREDADTIEDEAEESKEEASNTDNEIVLGEPFEFEGGDFVVTVQSYSLVKGWEDETVLKIVYDFTNNSEEEAYGHDIMFTGYQNGIQLDIDSGYSDDIDFGISEKGVKPGATIQGVEYGISLEDDSEVELEVECWLSFEEDEEEVFVTIVDPSSL